MFKHGDERSKTGPWSKAGVNCTHLINQSTTAPSVLSRNVLKLDLTKSRYPSPNYPSRSRIELALALAVITSFWRIHIKEQVGRVWKWVILIYVALKPFLTCLWEFFSLHHRLSTISFPTSTQSSIHLLSFLILNIERKHAGNDSSDPEGSWWWCKGRRWGFFRNFLIFPFFHSWFKRFKGVFNPHSEHLKIIESEVDE